MNKTQIMEMVAAGGPHECYEHQNLDGTTILYDITEARRMLSIRQFRTVSIDIEDVAPHLREHRVFDPQRVKDLSTFSWKHDPAICVEYREKDGSISHIFADGVHRIMRREKEGMKQFNCVMIPDSEMPRPAPGAIRGGSVGIDWGDELIDGKIVRR